MSEGRDHPIDRLLAELGAAAARQDRGMLANVRRGFSEATEVNSYWIVPPSASALNGHFAKMILNPQVSRYLTILPVGKEEALKPIPPFAN